MSEKNYITKTEKILSILANFLALILAFSTSIISLILNYIFDFFSYEFTFKVWQILLLFVIIMLIHFVLRIMLLRLKTKRKFKKGDNVQIQDRAGRYIVSGYSFFKPEIVYCYSIENMYKYKFEQYLLEPYK